MARKPIGVAPTTQLQPKVTIVPIKTVSVPPRKKH
jgi:hypothetical protein